MKKIATLGPVGTFSDKAAEMYVNTLCDVNQVDYFSSIKKALESIGRECDVGVLPIENFSEGFISLVLDFLVDAELYIIGEILLPIQFSFVGTSENVGDVKNLYVQFVAKGQCAEFLDSLDNVNIVTTESNIESLELALNQKGVNGAVVPAGSFNNNDFGLVIDNINDFENNQTRFLVLANIENESVSQKMEGYKTSIIVLDDNDHPGLLESILSSFSQRGINLSSIISRPTRKIFGKYHFFIDFEGHVSDGNVVEALREIDSINKVKVLGSYPKAVIG